MIEKAFGLLVLLSTLPYSISQGSGETANALTHFVFRRRRTGSCWCICSSSSRRNRLLFFRRLRTAKIHRLWHICRNRLNRDRFGFGWRMCSNCTAIHGNRSFWNCFELLAHIRRCECALGLMAAFNAKQTTIHMQPQIGEVSQTLSAHTRRGSFERIKQCWMGIVYHQRKGRQFNHLRLKSPLSCSHCQVTAFDQKPNLCENTYTLTSALKRVPRQIRYQEWINLIDRKRCGRRSEFSRSSPIFS